MRATDAIRIVTTQTIPALKGSGGDGHVDALNAVIDSHTRLTDAAEAALKYLEYPGYGPGKPALPVIRIVAMLRDSLK